MSETPEYEWDEAKNVSNIDTHGVSFEAASNFDWDTCTEFEDDRFNYDEVRSTAIGLIQGRLHTMSFTYRGERIRIISLRRSTPQERRMYHD